MAHSSWKFKDPPDAAVFTTESVVKGGKPILYVSHDDGDGAWQFHSGDRVSVKEAMVLALAEVVSLDPSIEELADLPCGWTATRVKSTAAWVRAPIT
jgi:hypothetical protein